MRLKLGGFKMEISDILYFYFRIVMNFIIILALIYFIFSKRKYFPEHVESVFKYWLSTGKNRYHCEVGIRIFMLILLVTFTIVSLPYFKDIPYIRDKEFEIITGIVDVGDNTKSDTYKRRYVSILQQETNEKISVSFFDSFVHSGEKITVICLPNTKFGTRVQEEEK